MSCALSMLERDGAHFAGMAGATYGIGSRGAAGAATVGAAAAATAGAAVARAGAEARERAV